METKQNDNYLNELKSILTEVNPYKAILFGSYAYGKINEDSDIDLIVVMDKDEMPKTFNERLNNYSSIKKHFRFLKNKVPMDLIVYTKPEWDNFIKADNSFTREILEKGTLLI
ncbi:MAG: nucleotidyltransferase domain-containing protein [Desulfamplus sp.]|nr:nucleotidyltransferase domain-containing protein [Desulfamplus sp.]